MDTTELQKNIKDTNARLAATRTELNALQKSLEFKWDEAKWKRSQELAKQEVEETRKSLEQLKQLQAQYDAEGLDNTTEAYARLGADIVKINEKLEIAERRTEAINRQKLDHIRAEWDKVGDSMIRVGKQLSLISAAVTAAGGLAVKGAMDAIVAFIEGLGEMEKNGQSTIVMLQELGLTEVRLSNSILALAGNSQLLADSVRLANESWDENTALASAAEIRYKTMEAQIQITKNSLNELSISFGEILLPAVEKGNEAVQDFTRWLSELDEGHKRAVVGALAFVAAMGPLTLAAGGAAKAVGAVIGAINALKAATAIAAPTVTLVATGLAILGGVAVGAIVSNMSKAATETENLTKSLNKLKDSYADSVDAIKSSIEADKEKVDNARELIAQLNEVNGTNEAAADIVERLNGLLGDNVFVLNEETGAYESAKGSVKQVAIPNPHPPNVQHPDRPR